ncbi:MAG: CDP-alcohol phosphatidyltransferase family protein [Candidatus Omnitrophica bacterium]|nr:CDP-alcohol phosphatidyltransferase family protein [Candidatus Omnitrophota bacterium]
MKLVIYDYKIDSECCFFMSINSELALDWFIEFIKEVSFEEVIFCTEETERTRQSIEAKLGKRPDIQIVSSLDSPAGVLTLKANYIYDRRRLTKLIRKGAVNLSPAILWEIKNKRDVKNAEAALDRIRNFPIGRYINLPLAKAMDARLVKTSVTPNQLTFISLALGILGALCFASHAYGLLILAAIFIQLHYILDFADGHLARLRGTASGFGAFLDGMTNKVVESFCYVGISYGLFMKYDRIFFLIIGLLVIVGHFMIDYISFLREACFGRNFSYSYHVADKKRLFRAVKKVYWFLEQGDVRFYIISIFAVLNKLEIAVIYFAIDFNARWIFNVVKVICRKF